MMRDGQPALVSRGKSSLVLVRPAARQLQANGRPVFVVGINNLGKQPVDFVVAQVEAVQHVAGSDYEMKVVTYEMLVQEEKNRQVAAAILTGVQLEMPTVPRRQAMAITQRLAAGQALSTVRLRTRLPRTMRLLRTKP
jgi:NADH/NAD ratio-sensing transcriptional regulator Rex